MEASPEILLVPLDGRPCNARFPVQLAAIAGWRVITPPPECLGTLAVGCRQERIAEWAARQTSRLRASVVSTDALLYGGLVQSREPDVSARCELLQFLANAGQRGHAFAVIPRTSITVDSEETAAWHSLLSRLQELEGLAGPDVALEATELRRQLPTSLIDGHRRMRARNLRVNVDLLRRAADEHWAFFGCGQEDCTVTGPHVAEQKQLQAVAEAVGVGDRFCIAPGADELASALTARCIAQGRAIRVAVTWSELGASRRVSPCEDRPVEGTLLGQCRMVGVTVVDSVTDADFALYVNAPRERGCRSSQVSAEDQQYRQELHLRRLEPIMSADLPLAVADVAWPNGSEPALVDALVRSGVYTDLLAYAGWNTAGNSIGSALAQSVVNLTAASPNRLEQAGFLLERLCDDFLFQIRVRPRLMRRARELGVSVYDFGEAQAELTEYLREQMRNELVNLAELAGLPSLGRGNSFRRLALPWNRAFEVDVCLAVEWVESLLDCCRPANT